MVIIVDNYYEILGLNSNCNYTKEEVNTAFKKNAKIYHPDNKVTGSSAKFLTLVEARDYLLTKTDSHLNVYVSNYNGNDINLINLLSKLNNENKNEVRIALEKLGSNYYKNNRYVIKVLTEFTYNKNNMIRRNALISLGNIGGISEIKTFARLLDDDWEHIRCDTVRALGNIGDPTALEYLENMSPFDEKNTQLTMQEVKESIYRIKKKNRLYTSSRKCPYCDGYDIDSIYPPYHCHDCNSEFYNQVYRGKYNPVDEYKWGEDITNNDLSKNDTLKNNKVASSQVNPEAQNKERESFFKRIFKKK